MVDSILASGVNWWGILASTVALLLFVVLRRLYQRAWKGMSYRRDGAAPKLKGHPLGGWNGWKGRVSYLPLTVLLIYFGFVCLFIGRVGTYIAAGWCWVWALVLITTFVIFPAYRKAQKAAEMRKEKRAEKEKAATQFPGDDAADFKVVSSFEPVDSDRRPWWRRRRRDTLKDSVA